MPILAITITKPQANSRLGVTFNVTDEAVYVKEADEGGTDLRRGQEVLRINESSMQNIGAGGLKTVLASLPAGDVIFIVKSRASPNGITFKVENRNISAKMKTAINDMPKIFKDASVPWDKWLLIYTLIAQELLPVSLNCVISNERYNRDMKSYLQNQRSKYTDTLLEKTMHMKGVQTGILHNNVTLLAMAVKDRVNSVLAKYHITAVLAYESIGLPRYPGQNKSNHLTIAVGLNFYSVDYLTVNAIPSECMEPIIATAMNRSASVLES